MHTTSWTTRVGRWIKAHKKTSIVLVLALAGATGLAYRHWSGSTTAPQYVLAHAKRGVVTVTVGGTGQVAAVNQLTLQTKASGIIEQLNATVGQSVTAGALIATVEPGDAAREYRTAELSYQKLITIDPNDLRNAKEAVTSAQDKARSTLVTTSSTLPDTLDDIQGLLRGYLSPVRNNFSTISKSYVDRATQSYYAANQATNDFLKSYRAQAGNSLDAPTIKLMLTEAGQVAGLVANAAKDTKDAVAYVRDHDDKATGSNATDAYTTAGTTADTAATANSNVATAASTLADAEATLTDLQNGPDAVDLSSEQLTLNQKREALEDHYVRAPFNGIIASLPVKQGDDVSSGTAVATLITPKKLVTLSLNEIDAAKVAVGQKATVTFDAIPNLTAPGHVSETDLIGTVSQGVVNYAIKIALEETDSRIKPGMSANATIVTAERNNVLAIPAGAIKTSRNQSTVEVMDPGATTPRPVPVTLGLIGDDSSEITAGLNAGDQYVARTITTSTATTATTPTGPGLLFGGNRTTTGRTSPGGAGGFSR